MSDSSSEDDVPFTHNLVGLASMAYSSLPNNLSTCANVLASSNSNESEGTSTSHRHFSMPSHGTNMNAAAELSESKGDLSEIQRCCSSQSSLNAEASEVPVLLLSNATSHLNISSTIEAKLNVNHKPSPVVERYHSPNSVRNMVRFPNDESKPSQNALNISSMENPWKSTNGDENFLSLPSNAEKRNSVTSNPPSLPTGPLYNWQATMTTVKERFAFLFNNEVLSDVHFLVGKDDSVQKIPAHKFVLSVGSAVFDAMFNGKLCTKAEEIELPDVEPQAFLALLRFLYSDEVLIGPETVMTVLYTAKKYAVPALERHCVEFLKCNLSPDNAFMLLTQARLFDEPQLAALCLDTIDKNTTDALLADGFTDIDHHTLCLVLERDTLRIRESKLFQAIVRWSKAKCEQEEMPLDGINQRKILGRALELVRFPLMTIEEFALVPAQSSILTDKEIVQLFLYFTINPKPSVHFLDVPRCCMTGKEVSVCRFPQIESRWGYSGSSDMIRFIVDRRIFVVGFGMYGSTHGPSEYEIQIQIIHTSTGKICGVNDTNFTSDGSMHTFKVMFQEPVEVLPNSNYTAYATLKGPDSHYGTKGLRKISVECPSGERVTFQFTYAAGSNNGTSVEDGQIPEIIFYT